MSLYRTGGGGSKLPQLYSINIHAYYEVYGKTPNHTLSGVKTGTYDGITLSETSGIVIFTLSTPMLVASDGGFTKVTKQISRRYVTDTPIMFFEYTDDYKDIVTAEAEEISL